MSLISPEGHAEVADRLLDRVDRGHHNASDTAAAQAHATLAVADALHSIAEALTDLHVDTTVWTSHDGGDAE